jgi:hypothetical protein
MDMQASTKTQAVALLQRVYDMAKAKVAAGDTDPALKRQMAAARVKLKKAGA